MQPVLFRIFLASPGDVQDERELSRAVIEQIRLERAFRGRVNLECIAWDQPGVEIAMEAGLTPQEAINRGIAKPSECDLVIVILWSRMGTPLPPEYTKPDGTTFLSGTEWEYHEATTAARRTGMPAVWLYRRMQDPDVKLGDKDLDDKRRQWQQVESFFNAFVGKDGALSAGVNPYKTPDEFRRHFEQHLRDRLTALFPLTGPASPAWPSQGPADTPDPWSWREWLAATLLAHRYTKRYLRNLLADHGAFTFLGAKPLELEHIYVSLKVGTYTPRVWEPDDPAPVGEGRTVEVPEALMQSRRSRRLVVLGDPGSGKTTLLKYLMLRLGLRDPGLALFARALITTPMTRILEPLCRFLSGANVYLPGILSSLAALIVWLVQVFGSSLPSTALVVWLLFFVLLLSLVMKFSRRATAVNAGLAMGLLAYAGWWQPHLVAPVAVWLMGLSVGILSFPVWVQPPLALLRKLLQGCTRYPLPIYLTLNNLARDTRRIEDHLVDAVAERGFPHPRRFVARKLARGECILLLDALDEVVDARAHGRVIAEVNRLRSAYGEGNQIIVTSRIAGFQHALGGYQQLEVQEFNQEQIEHFVRSWFADTDESQRQIDGLLQGLGLSPRMRLLASNPLLLSLMALLYERNWRLPERRVDLYEACVTLLIAEWEDLKGVPGTPQFSPAHKQQVLTQIAVQFHTAGLRVFEDEQLLAALAEVLLDGDTGEPQAFLDEIMTRTGLLRQKSRTSYDFVHLTFQEYFTACAWREPGADDVLQHVGDPWWQEVIRLYAGLERDATALLVRLRQHDVFLAAGCLADCREVDTPEFRHAAEAIVGDLQALARGDAGQRQDAADALAEVGSWGATTFLTDFIVAMAHDEAEPELVLAALLALVRAADKSVVDPIFARMGRILHLLHGQLPLVTPAVRERILALLDGLGYPLVYVPAGEFVMGSDSGFAHERPRHTVTVGEYWMDKFPVTNAQFARFVQETGDEARGNWQSVFTPGKEHHPVVNITRDDACRYGAWCGKQLPTEAQWEKAARGTDGREYPWGNQWDGNKCNASGRGTTPVGAYMEDVSPYGCYDMAGNVSEWCQDWYDKEYYRCGPERDLQGPAVGASGVIRGGGWYDVARFCRAAFRSLRAPDFRDSDLGFRLAMSVSLGP